MTDSSIDPVLVPVFDSFATVPEYEGLRAAFASGDWLAFEAELETLPSEEQSHALTLFAEHDGGVDAFLTEAEGEHPESPAAATALAVRRISVGWEYRTRAAVSDLSPEQVEEFWKYLRFAERALIEVCAAHPEYVPAWTARLHTARGLQLGLSEGYRRFRRRPETRSDVSAQLALQQLIDPKWSGTRQEADEFARSTARSAPDGSNSGALVAIMHLERWAAPGGGPTGQALLKVPSVVEELRAAASRSVLHPSHRLTPLGVVAHSAFLLVFWLADEPLDASRHLDVLGGRAARFPLEYLRDSRGPLMPWGPLATVWREVWTAGDAAKGATE